LSMLAILTLCFTKESKFPLIPLSVCFLEYAGYSF
jgi:hypothetical protein